MFNNKFKYHQLKKINGMDVWVDGCTFDYIRKLEELNRDLKHKIASLEHEIEQMKPVIKHKNLKPAMSDKCDDCRFVVKNRWNGDILGCRKDAVCSDYAPKETD